FNTFPPSLRPTLAAAGSLGPVVAKWDVTTADRGDYQPGAKRVTLRVKATGAYLVRASAPGIQSTTVVLITDLVVVQKLHRDGALSFATDARGGAPVANADVIAKQWWYEGGNTHTAFTRGRTDADGLFTMPLQRGPGRSGFRAAALVYQAARYAFTPSLW